MLARLFSGQVFDYTDLRDLIGTPDADALNGLVLQQAVGELLADPAQHTTEIIHVDYIWIAVKYSYGFHDNHP